MPIDHYVEPDDGGSDKFIWSRTKLLVPFSYMNPKVLLENLQPEAPPPTYESYTALKVFNACNYFTIYSLIEGDKDVLGKKNSTQILEK